MAPTKVNLIFTPVYPRPFSGIDINDLEQGQGHVIRGQMKKIIPFFGCDCMSMVLFT